MMNKDTKLLFLKSQVLASCEKRADRVKEAIAHYKEKTIKEEMERKRYKVNFFYSVEVKKWDRETAEKMWEESESNLYKWYPWKQHKDKLVEMEKEYREFYRWVYGSMNEKIELTFEEFKWLCGEKKV